MTSHLQTSNQTIDYNYKYHIVLTTSVSRYVYTNLYQEPTSSPPTISVPSHLQSKVTKTK